MEGPPWANWGSVSCLKIFQYVEWRCRGLDHQLSDSWATATHEHNAKWITFSDHNEEMLINKLGSKVTNEWHVHWWYICSVIFLLPNHYPLLVITAWFTFYTVMLRHKQHRVKVKKGLISGLIQKVIIQLYIIQNLELPLCDFRVIQFIHSNKCYFWTEFRQWTH